MKKKRAFIINFSDQGLGNVRNFVDEIISITQGKVNIFNVDDIQYNVKQVFADYNFNPKEDIIILNGHIHLVFIVAKVIYQNYRFKETHFLLWDSVNRKYLRKDFL